MALVHTPDPEFGSPCPEFNLPATNGETVSLSQFSDGKPLLVLFMCNHCPYVKAILDRLVEVGRYFQSSGIHMVAISSNDVSRYPDDSFEKMNDSDKTSFLKEKLHRPIRICGMVKNEGEPGGGPFFIADRKGNVSLQIIESLILSYFSKSILMLISKNYIYKFTNSSRKASWKILSGP